MRAVLGFLVDSLVPVSTIFFWEFLRVSKECCSAILGNIDITRRVHTFAKGY
jgi:hypothetical protein